jgi:regulation of enolase protein 1 (concanavalin A-like superfamily)
MESPTGLSAMPMPLRWDNAPVRAETDGRSRLLIEAGPKTDIFVDPGGDGKRLNAPRLFGPAPPGDLQFSARVEVAFTTRYDAGVLLVWADEQRWAKLCFEYSPDGEPMIVSVVTRRSSDDANAFVVAGRTAWLRISRLGRAFAFHASIDGARWVLVRYFDLGAESVLVGFEAQSPHGTGCAATFDEVSFCSTTLANLRDGS